MVMHAMAQTAIRELDRRTNDGFDVRLLWNSQTDRVFVIVADQRHGDSFSLEVDAADALEACHHPFAYTSNQYGSRPLAHSPARLRAEEER
jgi:hypothetical protein